MASIAVGVLAKLASSPPPASDSELLITFRQHTHRSPRPVSSVLVTAGSSLVPGPVDIRRMELLVLRVLHVFPHPEENSPWWVNNLIWYSDQEFNRGNNDFDLKLCINKVPNTYSEEWMDDRLVVGLTNPKPEIIQGWVNRSKMLCARDPMLDKTELILAPDGTVPGDRVEVEGYPWDPELPFMLPVESPMQRITADLRVDGHRQVTYRGVPLTVKGKPVTTTELRDCPLAFM